MLKVALPCDIAFLPQTWQSLLSIKGTSLKRDVTGVSLHNSKTAMQSLALLQDLRRTTQRLRQFTDHTMLAMIAPRREQGH